MADICSFLRRIALHSVIGTLQVLPHLLPVQMWVDQKSNHLYPIFVFDHADASEWISIAYMQLRSATSHFKVLEGRMILLKSNVWGTVRRLSRFRIRQNLLPAVSSDVCTPKYTKYSRVQQEGLVNPEFFGYLRHALPYTYEDNVGNRVTIGAVDML